MNNKNKKSYSISSIFVLMGCLWVMQGCETLTGNRNNYEANSPNGNTSTFIASGDASKLSNEQQTLYRQDAEVLALRYINEKDSTQTELPESLIESLYNGLVRIVTSTQPKIIEFTQTHPVHIHIGTSAHQIVVYPKSAAPWLRFWRNGITKTGNPRVDALIHRFDLTLYQYYKLSAFATLQSSRALNTYAVARLFGQLDEIDHAYPNFYVNDGSDIKVFFFDDYLRYTFEYGYGDCIAGCISRHRWKFNVHKKDGSVTFIGEDGDPLPDS